MAQLFALRLVQNQIKLARPSFPHSSSDKTQLSLDISGTGCSKRNGRGEKIQTVSQICLGVLVLYKHGWPQSLIRTISLFTPFTVLNWGLFAE